MTDSGRNTTSLNLDQPRLQGLQCPAGRGEMENGKSNERSEKDAPASPLHDVQGTEGGLRPERPASEPRPIPTQQTTQPLRAVQPKRAGKTKGRAPRRTWGAKAEPEAPARQVWAYLYPGEQWPRGWHVLWGRKRRCRGETFYHRRVIYLTHKHAVRRDGGIVEILIHEFWHVRRPKLSHGLEMARLIVADCKKLGIEALHHLDEEG